uniref:Ovule protein n=1 Tax=Heterorhabditis bacteriophora TaxID=37862 RepID=A0A1I7WDL8_HETBA
MTEQSCLVKATIMLHPYLVSLCPSKWPCQWGESLLVAKARSLWFNVGAQNHLLRAVSLYYYPLIGCFVIQGSRNTYIIELIIITIFLSKLKRLYTVCRSKIYIGIYKYQYYWYDLPKIF